MLVVRSNAYRKVDLVMGGVLMKTSVLQLPKRGSYREFFSYDSVFALALVVCVCTVFSLNVVSVRADNFVDIFYTNSFRGSFEWFKKLDWIGMIVQAVISIFSLVGVALIVIRVMTSMLYLSAKGLWEEVHDLKDTGGSEMYDFGFVGMAKKWAQGKAGTGLDAILGAVLVLLPDVKRYSDFGDKSGQKFDEDVTMAQYILKIALPTVLAVFFLAMGFNGTLVKGLAVTVDAMGTFADKAVSVNYSGFVEDLVASGSGYKFTYNLDGTEKGQLEQSLAKDLYGRVVSEVRGATTAQLYAIGQQIEVALESYFDDAVASSNQISEQVRSGLEGDQSDRYYSYLGYDIVANINETAMSESAVSIPLSELIPADMGLTSTPNYSKTYHIFIKQTNSFDGSYFNVDELG